MALFDRQLRIAHKLKKKKQKFKKFQQIISQHDFLVWCYKIRK